MTTPSTKPALVILAAGRARRYGGCKPLAPVGPRGEAVIDRYGNTSSASIPLALHDAISNNRVHDGDHLLLTGFGGGMTWASAVLRWGA